MNWKSDKKGNHFNDSKKPGIESTSQSISSNHTQQSVIQSNHRIAKPGSKIFYVLYSNSVTKSKLKYPRPKNEDDYYDPDILQLKKNMPPGAFLYLTKAHDGISVYNIEDIDSLSRLLRRIKNGNELDTPILEINVDKKKIYNHDGRHRALASMILGIKNIPIYEVAVHNNGIIIPLNKLTKEQRELLKRPEDLLTPQQGNFDYGDES